MCKTYDNKSANMPSMIRESRCLDRREQQYERDIAGSTEENISFQIDHGYECGTDDDDPDVSYRQELMKYCNDDDAERPKSEKMKRKKNEKEEKREEREGEERIKKVEDE